jgi:hypothetical protein
MRRLIRLAATMLSTLAVLAVFALADPPTAEQRQKIAEATKKRAEIQSHLTAKRYDTAARGLEALEDMIAKLKESGLAEDDTAIANLSRFIETTRKQYGSRLPLPEESKSKPTPSAGAEPQKTGGVSFVRDVAPVLSRNCIRCHGGATPKAKFSQSTYKALMKGGERGDDVVPGKPDESLVVLMLRGKEEPRMPPGNRRLREDLIATIERWIREGAKFDGAPQFNGDTPLAQIVPTEEEELKKKLAALSDTQLAELRRTRAKEQWKLANPTKPLAMAETEQFIVCGSLSAETIEHAGEWCETALRELKRMFGRAPNETIWRGKLTVHLFAQRYEYGEHAQMIEQRELPAEVIGHYRAGIETPYLAVPAPDADGSNTLKGLVIEQLAAAYLTTLGNLPTWFQTGFSRYVAGKLEAKAEVYRLYRSAVRDWFAEGRSDLGPVIENSVEWHELTAVSYGIVDFLASMPQGDKRVATLALELAKKPDTDAALKAVFRLDRKSLASGLAGHAQKKYATLRKKPS